MKRFFPLLVGSLMVMLALALVAVAQMHGTARVDGTNVWVRWSNVPAAVVVQRSVGVTNWADVLIVSQVGGTGLVYFEYLARTGDESNAAALYRLRAIAPVTPPP